MSTFFSDYPHTDDETATAASRAALNGRRPDVADEPTPRGWRLNLLAAGSVAGVILLVVGGVCLGLLLGAQPESEGLTDAQLWTQNTDLMARSAFAVIALFLGGIMLLFVGAGHLYRQERREIVRALSELSRVADLAEVRGAIRRLQDQQDTLAEMIVTGDGRMVIAMPNHDVYELGKQVGREEAERHGEHDQKS